MNGNYFSLLSADNSDHLFVCRKLLDFYKIKYTQNIKSTICEHYRYPSLQTVCDCLLEYGIKNVAINVDKSELDRLPAYTVLHIKMAKNGEEKLVVLIEADEGEVTVLERGNIKINYPSAEFKQHWTGIAILSEITAASKEKRYKDNLKSQIGRQLGIGIFFLVIVLLCIRANFFNATLPTEYLNIGIFLCLAGLFLSYLLVMQSFDKGSSLVSKLCRFTKSDCDTVLTGRHSNFLGIVKWSEVGLYYFLFSVFLYLFFSNAILQHLLVIVSMLTVPVVFFSLYYQWRVIKKWCTVCMAIQVILVLQLFINLLYTDVNAAMFLFLKDTLSGSPTIVISLLLSIFIPLITLIYALPFSVLSANYSVLATKVQSYQRNGNYFKNHILTTKRIENSALYSPLVIGNKESDRVITYVTSPKCAPCKASNREIQDLLALFDEDVRIEIFFLLANEFRKAKAYQITRHLIHTYLRSEEQFIYELKRWYSSEGHLMEQAVIQEMLGTSSEQVDEILERHLQWAKKQSIEHTPTFFFRDGILNDNYPIEGLKFHIAQW